MATRSFGICSTELVALFHQSQSLDSALMILLLLQIDESKLIKSDRSTFKKSQISLSHKIWNNASFRINVIESKMPVTMS